MNSMCLQKRYTSIHCNDIIINYFSDELIISKRKKTLKTVCWFNDSLPSKIAERTYAVREINKRTHLIETKYHRPSPSSVKHKNLVKKLEISGIKK